MARPTGARAAGVQAGAPRACSAGTARWRQERNSTATTGGIHILRRWGGHLSSSRQLRKHLLDRPALATPAEQCLDPDARPLRPLDEGERLPVPREHVTAAVWHRGRRSVIAGRPGTRQVPRPVEPSPLRVLAQGQVGLSFQPAPELLVRDGPLVGREVPPGAASLVSHIGTLLGLGARQLQGGPARQVGGSTRPGCGTSRARPRPARSHGGGASRPGDRCPPARPGTYHSSSDAGSAADRRASPRGITSEPKGDHELGRHRRAGRPPLHAACMLCIRVHTIGPWHLYRYVMFPKRP